jgi:hypothetical protein
MNFLNYFFFKKNNKTNLILFPSFFFFHFFYFLRLMNDSEWLKVHFFFDHWIFSSYSFFY